MPPVVSQAGRRLIGGGGPLRPPLEAPTAEPTAVEDLTAKLNRMLREEKIRGGFDPDRPLGEFKHGTYLKRFGGDDSPVIDSGLRKPGSTAEVANPTKLLSKVDFKDSLPENSPLLHNPKALEAAYKLAVELKKAGKSGIGDLMKQGRE